MRGAVIYNESLKTPSYTENVRCFCNEMQLPAVSNKELYLCLKGGNLNSFPFDYAVFLDKDICAARALEKSGVRLFNSADAVLTCDNKAYTHIALSNAVPQPDTFIPPMRYFAENDDFTVPFPYPVVIKECMGSWGKQVYLAHNRTEAEKIVQRIGSKPYIIQEYIETHGTDYRIYTVGGKAVAAMRRRNDRDFRANCEIGGVAEKCELSYEMQSVAEKTAQILKLDFGGIDLMETESGIVVIEANSSAMTKNIMALTGVNIPALLKEHILKAL